MSPAPTALINTLESTKIITEPVQDTEPPEIRPSILERATDLRLGLFATIGALWVASLLSSYFFLGPLVVAAKGTGVIPQKVLDFIPVPEATEPILPSTEASPAPEPSSEQSRKATRPAQQQPAQNKPNPQEPPQTPTQRPASTAPVQLPPQQPPTQPSPTRSPAPPTTEPAEPPPPSPPPHNPDPTTPTQAPETPPPSG